MTSFGTLALITAACLSAAAAMAHLACIVGGAPVYRFMGAGERMARAAKAGHLRPTLMTLAIAAVLALWAAFALSGAGLIAMLPLTKPALVAIAAVLYVRALGFSLLKSRFPENSDAFWWVSSGICGVMATLFAGGAAARWSAL